MEQYKLVKIKSGTAIHLSEYFISISKVEGYSVYCGSGKTGFRNIQRKVNKEVKFENITCKKCQKRYKELQSVIETEKELSLEEHCKMYGNSIMIAK
jgi:hypothetical protein